MASHELLLLAYPRKVLLNLITVSAFGEGEDLLLVLKFLRNNFIVSADSEDITGTNGW